MKIQEEKHSKTTEGLHDQLKDVKNRLSSSSDKCSKLEANLKEREEKLNTASQKVIQLEADLRIKVIMFFSLYKL